MTWMLRQRLRLLVALVIAVTFCFLTTIPNREQIHEASFNMVFELPLLLICCRFEFFSFSNTTLQTIYNIIVGVNYSGSNFIQGKEFCKSLAQDSEVPFMLSIFGKSNSSEASITAIIIGPTT
ncbi:hypothetical protein SEVIR_2G368400v4 [Setaria viridis]|uniref:Uncharacterized protein n=2 Tax=Setaria TaxID=4554 RepID=A0A368Q6D8_SETIT|nr:hypothetical protein SETIT_2G357300v2 [Setaria italica]TKW35390.1 hypothetical protein SEVIR_2G368400v2 [Setaria viridis]